MRDNKKNKSVSKNSLNKTLDLIRYRREQFKKKKLHRWWYKIILLIIVGVVVVWAQNLDQNDNLGAEFSGFPVQLNGGNALGLTYTNQSLVVTTNESIELYDFDGKKQRNIVHGFSKPITKTAGQYILTYNQGGYDIRLDQLKGAGGEKTRKFENQILFGRVHENGNIAIVSRNQEYMSEIAIYDETLSKPIFRYYMNEFAISMDFINSHSCVIATQTVKGGKLETVVYGLDFYKEAVLFESHVHSSMVLSISRKNNGVIALVCTEELILYDEVGENPMSYPYESNILKMNNEWKEGVIVVLENLEKPNQSDILLFTNTTTPKEKKTVNGMLKQLSIGNDRILCLSEDRVLELDMKLEQKQAHLYTGNYLYIEHTSRGYFAVSQSTLEKLAG